MVHLFVFEKKFDQQKVALKEEKRNLAKESYALNFRGTQVQSIVLFSLCNGSIHIFQPTLHFQEYPKAIILYNRIFACAMCYSCLQFKVLLTA